MHRTFSGSFVVAPCAPDARPITVALIMQETCQNKKYI